MTVAENPLAKERVGDKLGVRRRRESPVQVYAPSVALVVGWVNMMEMAFVLARIDRRPGQFARRDHRNEREP
jgi:hypothetical protein